MHEVHEKFWQEVCIKFHFLPAHSAPVGSAVSSLLNITCVQMGSLYNVARFALLWFNNPE